MIFTPTALGGVWIVDLEPLEDERGMFARAWCAREFSDRGLPSGFVQCSVSRTRRKDTLRGMHFQAAPHAEDKLIRCTRGSVWEVALDLRDDSPTRLAHVGVELDQESGRALFVPKGCATGFLTLTDDTEVLYHMTEFYHPEAARGARWNDPAFAIPWPSTEPFLHPRDASYPDFGDVA